MKKKKYILCRVYPAKKLTIAEYDEKRELLFFTELTKEEIELMENYSICTGNVYTEILWCYQERYIISEFLKNMDKG